MSSPKAASYLWNTHVPAARLAGGVLRGTGRHCFPQLWCLGCCRSRSGWAGLGASTELQWSQERMLLFSLSTFLPSIRGNRGAPSLAGGQRKSKEIPSFLLLRLSPHFCLLYWILSYVGCLLLFCILGAVWVYVCLASTLNFVEQKRREEVVVCNSLFSVEPGYSFTLIVFRVWYLEQGTPSGEILILWHFIWAVKFCSAFTGIKNLKKATWIFIRLS